MSDPLQRTDLNLLVSFRVLFEERCVTRAAERLFVSQPAMSKTLQRLRVLFDDPLFVRAGRGLAPTPKAQSLFTAVQPILDQIRATVLEGTFEPATEEGRINIIAPDTLAAAIMPPLFLAVRQAAPRVRLVSDSYSDNHLEWLSSGKGDFSVFLDQDYGEEFQVFRLGECPLVCWMRAGHPLADADTVSIRELLEYPLVSLTLPARRPLPRRDHAAKLDLLFQQHHLDDHASANVTSLYVAAQMLHCSDAMMLGAPLWGGAAAGGLVSKRCRETESLVAPIALIQHRRTIGSPLHTWMRELVRQAWSSTNAKLLAPGGGARPSFTSLVTAIDRRNEDGQSGRRPRAN